MFCVVAPLDHTNEYGVNGLLAGSTLSVTEPSHAPKQLAGEGVKETVNDGGTTSVTLSVLTQPFASVPVTV